MYRTHYVLLGMLSLLPIGCASAPQRPFGASLDAPRRDPLPEQPAPRPPVPSDIVERSAQPFRGRRNADGGTLDQAQLFDELSRYDVLCLGEAHDAPRDHYAELAIARGIAQRAQISGRALGLGFEMFQAGYGDALYSYGIGRIDDASLRKRTQYDERWGYPYQYYRPILALGRAEGLPLKALNASRELTRAVAKQGFADLPPRLRRQLPDDLNLSDPEHRAEFDQLMASHPHSAGFDADNFYAAQVVWDETMADNATRWVSASAPSRQLVILAGSAHCRRAAIPARIERRAPLRVASVQLSAPTAGDSTGFSYTLLFDGPS
jgi:uncharacterized iron-regulated protein